MKSGSVSLPTVFFSFTMVLAILGLLSLHINVRFSLMTSTRGLARILTGNALNLQIKMEEMNLDDTESSYPWTWNISIYLVLWFLLSEFYSFPHIALVHILLYLYLSISFLWVLILIVLSFKCQIPLVHDCYTGKWVAFVY